MKKILLGIMGIVALSLTATSAFAHGGWHHGGHHHHGGLSFSFGFPIVVGDRGYYDDDYPGYAYDDGYYWRHHHRYRRVVYDTPYGYEYRYYRY